MNRRAQRVGNRNKRGSSFCWDLRLEGASWACLEEVVGQHQMAGDRPPFALNTPEGHWRRAVAAIRGARTDCSPEKDEAHAIADRTQRTSSLRSQFWM